MAGVAMMKHTGGPREVGGVLERRVPRHQEIVALDEDGRPRQELVGEILVDHLGGAEKGDLIAAVARAVEAFGGLVGVIGEAPRGAEHGRRDGATDVDFETGPAVLGVEGREAGPLDAGTLHEALRADFLERRLRAPGRRCPGVSGDDQTRDARTSGFARGGSKPHYGAGALYCGSRAASGLKPSGTVLARPCRRSSVSMPIVAQPRPS